MHVCLLMAMVNREGKSGPEDRRGTTAETEPWGRTGGELQHTGGGVGLSRSMNHSYE